MYHLCGEVTLGDHHSLSSSTVGVFQHLLPSLPSPPPSHLVSSVFSVLASVLDTHVPSLLTTLTSTPPHTPPQVQCLSHTNHSASHKSHRVKMVTLYQMNHAVSWQGKQINRYTPRISLGDTECRHLLQLTGFKSSCGKIVIEA